MILSLAIWTLSRLDAASTYMMQQTIVEYKSLQGKYSYFIYLTYFGTVEL